MHAPLQPTRREGEAVKDFEAGTPLLSPARYGATDSAALVDQPSRQPAPASTASAASVPLLLLLSLPRLGIQMAWAAQWAALGPYLGTMMPRFAVQLTQIIGPLTGILVAPTVGVLSDRSTSARGRRLPFMVGGGLATVASWALMAYARELGELCGDYGSGKPGEPTSRTWTALLTVLLYTWMDVAMNVVATPASLLVADLAGERQTMGSAFGQGWATLGAILISGYIQLFGPAHATLGYFLFLLSAVLLVSVGAVAVFAHDRPLVPDEKEPEPEETTRERVRDAFYSIYRGLRALPGPLAVYAVVFFCVVYGNTAYTGNKGQFFGVEVFGGVADNADACGDACSPAQQSYNRGVQLAGGTTDLICNVVGIAFAWVLPQLVNAFGVKATLSVMLIPQALLMAMAFCKVVAVDVLIVVIAGFSPGTVYALLVPVIVHVFGDKADIGIYVGALNSAGCFGQLLNFIVGAALVETPLGYKLPIFVGGAMSLLGLVICVLCFQVKAFRI